MIIENSNVELLESEGYLKDIERAARVCYASSPKGNTEEFVDRLVKMKHGRPLEFGTLYMPLPDIEKFHKDIEFFKKNRYSNVEVCNGMCYITTNFRVLVEHHKEELYWHSLIYVSSSSLDEFKKRSTVKWTISRVTADSFRTHTMISSLMQSTRYCNYSKGKFGHQVTFIRPVWFGNNQARWRRRVMKVAWWMSEKFYMLLIRMGCTAQEARDVLPLAIKTEFIQCAFDEDWKDFFRQRCSNAAHPDAKHIAEICKSKMTDNI